MKKIGIIADPHANLNALEAVFEDMPEVDKIICAGDLVGFGPRPNEVIEAMKKKNVLCVQGNHDHAVINKKVGSFDEETAKAIKWTWKNLKKENLNYLKKIRKKTKINEEGYEIFMTHGTPRNHLKESLFPGASKRALVNMTQGVKADIIVLGHTHVPLEQTIQGKLIVNPGGVGQPRDRNPDASYMVLKLGDEKELTHSRVSYDIDTTAQEIKNVGLPEKLAIRLHFGW
ncbi:hypothetical protein AKJ39_00845 [candidate division MSBL1 archaeon SCGC-AAA259J03]|uniref:Phosphoesterase n=2 Tax=candidate division MSBL1 TaxID=215777 RepID=A0A656YX58_9EURY|nr:hypothetical protein AKJ61_00955 [candidate division MSBL1 archaeon SCGC-AAA259B11]KXA98778.1 hypothetical protein AKJ39_00845 [candidate division MSBL1 archaeon SCGC-AAA259J03]